MSEPSPAPDESIYPSSSTQQSGVYPSSDNDWQEVEQALSRPLKQESTTVTTIEGVNRLSQLQRQGSGSLMMVETAFLASAAGLIWLVNYYVPLGPVLRVFFPIPIALIYLRWNGRAAWMGALIAGLLLAVLMGPVRSILYVMPFGLLGVLLGFLWRRRASWPVSVGIGSLLGALGLFFRIWFVSLLLGDDLWQYATNQITELLNWIFLKLGLLMQPSVTIIQIALVLMVLFNNLMYVFVVHLVALFLLDRLGNPIPRPPKWVQTLLDYE